MFMKTEQLAGLMESTEPRPTSRTRGPLDPVGPREASDHPRGETAVVRAKLAAGRLRRDLCVGRVDVVLGEGVCHGCDHPIPHDEVEMRARFRDGEFLALHARCFATWYGETQR